MAEYIEKQAFNDAIREAVRKYPNTFYNGLETARQIAHDLPSADVQPVRHGRWLETGDFSDEIIEWVMCSNCKAKIPDFDYPYCPNCGASMEVSE